MPQLRVLIAVPDPAEQKDLRDKLLKAGHLVIGRAAEAREVLRFVFETQPDLIIMDPCLPDYSGLGVAQVVDEHRVAPIVFVTRNADDIARQARSGWVFGYLVAPYDDDDLGLAVDVALANFRRLLTLEREHARLKKSLEARKVIERAKGLLADKKGLTEDEAYRYLQKLSMDSSRPLAAVAREVIRALG